MKALRIIGLAAWLACGNALADLVVAQIAPFSGPLAPTGKGLRAGAQLYFDAVNAAGGINGNKIRLFSADDGYNAEQTLKLVKETAQAQRPLAFLGIVGTGNVEILLKDDILGRLGIPLVGARSGASSLSTPPAPWLFLTRAGYEHEISRMLGLYLPLGYRRVAAFYQNDAFGRDGLKSLEQTVGKGGGELVARGSYEKNTTQVEAAVRSIAEASPQLVVMVSNTAASAEFVRQFRATGVRAQLATLSVTDGAQVVDKTGAAVAHGLAISQVVPDPSDSSLALIREIRERARKFPPTDSSPINHTFIEGYLAAKVLGEGIRRSGIEPTPRKLRDVLETISGYDAGGIAIGFAADDHVGSRYSDITILNRNGRLLR